MDLQHAAIIDYFKKITVEDRVPHAVLLVGYEAAGQLAMALDWSTMLLSSLRQEAVIHCSVCKSCQNVDKFVHPDLHFAFPVIKHEKFKREETTSLHFLKEWRSFLSNNLYGNLFDWLRLLGDPNKSANINVAECHQIIHNLGLKTYEGSYKIQIIWHAESLAKEGNRLLKLIEEPADDTIIILLANNMNAILNTIRSRCQILRIPPYSDGEIEDYLSRNYDLDEKALKEICYLSAGDLRKARELAEHAEENISKEMLEWFRICYKADPVELKKEVEYLSGMGRQNLKNFLHYTIHFLREYLVALNLQSTEKSRLSAEERNVALKMQKILDRTKTEQLHKLVTQFSAYIDRNLSLKIMMMTLSFKINEILRLEVNKFV